MPADANAKAVLTPVDQQDNPLSGWQPITVQFNPNKLHITYSTSTDAPASTEQQNVSHNATNSAVLSLDLEFDTADEGTTDTPVSVTTRTKPLEALVLPQNPQSPPGSKSAPPRVQFSWGDIVIAGFVRTLNIDYELFSKQGTPLRAKVSFSIQGQDSKLAANQTGPGANAPPPGAAGPGAAGGLGLGAVAGVGLGLSASLGVSAGIGLSAGIGIGASFSAGVSIGAQSSLAIGGESAAEFAARVGIDPTAWRAVAAGQVDSPLSIDAGVEIGFDASFSAGAGVGVTTGPVAGVSASIESSFGLVSSPEPDRSASLSAPGFSLAAAGGVQAALETVTIVKSESAASATRSAFAAPPRPLAPASSASLPPATLDAALRPGRAIAPPRPDRAAQPRTPLALTGLPSASAQASAPSAPPPPVADPRAATFGLGVPLRARVEVAAAQRSGSLGGAIPLRPRSRGGATPTSSDPTAAPWEALPMSGTSASARPVAKRSGCGCGCGCGCGGRR